MAALANQPLDLGAEIYPHTLTCCNGQPLTTTAPDTRTCPGCGCQVGLRNQTVSSITYCQQHRRPVGT